MKIDLIAFSKTGAELARKIIVGLNTCESTGYIAERHAEGTGFSPFTSVYELAASLFYETDALVFIGASGIAVRAVAPLLRGKLDDPAVVVCDECGRFAVSLLSGHAGGANLLAENIARVIGAVPVITTASDSHAALSGLAQPKNLILGIGCRRGLSAETIERAATVMLWDDGIALARVCGMATIDIKRDDEGLAKFVRSHGIPLTFYSACELNGASGEFSHSERVFQAVGTGNVCERAAALLSGGRMIMGKTARDGVTVSVFEVNAQDG